MVRGQFKSNTFRKVSVKTPGGRVSTQYKLRKPKAAHCGSCGAILNGVPRERPTTMKNLPKTHKRPERPFGGVLCSKCMREHFRKQALATEVIDEEGN